jgi:hypothetical protein
MESVAEPGHTVARRRWPDGVGGEELTVAGAESAAVARSTTTSGGVDSAVTVGQCGADSARSGGSHSMETAGGGATAWGAEAAVVELCSMRSRKRI